MPSLFHFLRRRIWALSLGLGLSALALALAGPRAVWLLLALALAAGLAGHFLAPPPKEEREPQPRPGDSLSVLPPLTGLLLEQLPMPVMLLDESQRIMFANRFMQELFGPDLERRPVSAVLRNPEVLEAIEQGNRGAQASVDFTLPVPIERHFEAFTARIHSSPPVTALIFHDLTAVRRSEQMRADFIANVSHELRTPLAAVSGFIDTLRGHAREDEEAREKFLDIMAVEAARMRRLIDDLLSLTRIEMNEHVPPSGRIELTGVIREVAAALAPLAKAERITIEISAGGGLPPVVGQRDEMIQLFQNLIHNAIKYGREGGHVWISLGPAAEGGMVFVTVRDDGEGIESSAVPRLTERFYRVDVKRSREKGGTGLGLAIVKHIVNRHQGRLTIESRQGEGSSFTVLLPVAEMEQKTEAQPQSAAPVTEML